MKFGHYTKAAALVVGASLVLAGCAASAPAENTGNTEAPRGGTLTIGAVQDVASWDPGQAHVGHLLQPYQAPYDTLILREPDGKLSPMLATEWEYNEDSTALTVDLRTDVTFSDGAEFNAEAVKANLEHFKGANGRQAAQLSSLESVEVVDADTVTINLAEPDPSFTYFLSQAAGFMGSPESLGTEEIKQTPVGSGPYVIDPAGTTPGSQYTFTAREDYWNPDLQKFDKIVFKVLTDATARLNALISGQVDITLLDQRNVAQAEGAGKELSANQADWTGLFLLDRDGKLNPALGDVRVRQAINFAIDRETMLEEIQLGRGTATTQVFGPKSGAYVDELDEEYPYDPKKAKALLKEAGYESGLEITLPVFTGIEAQSAMLVQQFADVGITLKLETIPPANLQSELVSGKYAMVYFFQMQADPWVNIKGIIGEAAFYNAFKTTTPELEELIEAVRFGGEDSAELAQEVNKYVVENAWFAPIYRLDQLVLIDPTKITSTPTSQQAVPSIYNIAPAK
ncbi:ABC transporter substrate-binding protein [Diaminobutyricimonas sp. LJ205]|uniref:ABC transporter substrate-binding protein n=1 Tax=Diaminobutyricimonas sp. LJ205 TaxID=2683590 RepID=UPI0012F4D137|nr:ABC transporter substrate-binding protein [Diaminobutyricimonas sp. LJ205]